MAKKCRLPGNDDVRGTPDGFSGRKSPEGRTWFVSAIVTTTKYC